jgi:hypothetical protein
MAEQFRLIADELRAHVQHTGGVSDMLDQALSDAKGLGTPPAAFGVLFTSIPGDIQPLVDEAIEVIQAAVDSIETTTEMVTDTIGEYETAEAANAEMFA